MKPESPWQILEKYSKIKFY